jgi:hypothetical protein
MRAFWWSTVAGVLLVTGFALWVIYAKPFPRDGSSVARAVIISPGENQLAAEYAWIAKHPEGATFPVEQALFCRAGRLYEKWTFGASNQREVYFDLGMNAKICDANSESGFIK